MLPDLRRPIERAEQDSRRLPSYAFSYASPFGGEGVRILWGLFDLRDRFELIDPAVCHQREIEMTVLEQIRPNVAPLLHNLIERFGLALGAREGQRTELKLIRAALLPGPAPRLQSMRAVTLPPAPNSMRAAGRSRLTIRSSMTCSGQWHVTDTRRRITPLPAGSTPSPATRSCRP